MEIKFAFDEDSSFAKTLDEVFKATSDLTIPLGLMAQSWYKSNKSIPAASNPGRYVDLTEKYKKSKRKKYGFYYPILTASGRLMGSITDPTHPEAINVIVNKRSLVLGTSVPYGIYHQSDQPRRKMPYRPFLFVGVEQIAPNDIRNNRLMTWFRILDNYMASYWRKLGKGYGIDS